MSISFFVRGACGLLLFCALSSFSGCDKSGDAKPHGKCGKHTTPRDSTGVG